MFKGFNGFIDQILEIWRGEDTKVICG